MKDNKDSITQIEQVLEHLKNGNDEGANSLLRALTKSREADLFSEIGKLTRELHDALNNFKLDSRMADLAAQDIPDAKDRLEYVLKMTDEAANKTMDAVDHSSAITDGIFKKTTELYQTWDQVNRKQVKTGEFKIFFENVGTFLQNTQADTTEISKDMTEILMAQGFQDLTGQMIKRVIELVHDVEESLVHTISIFGQMDDYDQAAHVYKKTDASAEGPIINAEKRDDVMTNQDDVDDLLSNLGF